MKKDHNRTVVLTCPVCRGKGVVESVKKEVFNDVKVDFQKMLKNLLETILR
jgi:hypothetical protein